MPMQWNEEADAKLFAGVLATSDGIKLDYSKLADWMGNECTAKAITHRISHVKKVGKESLGDTPSGTTDGAAAKTPKTPKTATKRKAKEVSDEDAEDGGDAEESPTKKKPRARAPPKSKATKTKAASDEDAEGQVNGKEASAKVKKPRAKAPTKSKAAPKKAGATAKSPEKEVVMEGEEGVAVEGDGQEVRTEDADANGDAEMQDEEELNVEDTVVDEEVEV